MYKVVNTNVQTTAILNSVKNAIPAPLPGTYFPIVFLTFNDIVLTDDNLASIRSSSTLFLDATNINANRNISVGDDTVENAKRLINLFDLNENIPTRLITIVSGDLPNANFVVTLGTNFTGTPTYENVIFINRIPSGPSYAQIISNANSYKNGYFSVSLGDTKDTIVFEIIKPQIN